MSTEAAQDEEDYMGDLSLFLPPDQSLPCRKTSKTSTPSQSSDKHKKPTQTLPWQERRKIDRERKQREEDQQTLDKCESAINSSNVGFKLLQQMGYTPGTALGKDGSGRLEPVGLQIRRSRAGLGKESPEKEKARREVARAESKRKTEEVLMEEFGTRQKSQWRSRRIVADFHKAKAALAQLENVEVLEPVKEDDGDGDGNEKEGEEEEEVITEEIYPLMQWLEHSVTTSCGQIRNWEFDPNWPIILLWLLFMALFAPATKLGKFPLFSTSFFAFFFSLAGFAGYIDEIKG